MVDFKGSVLDRVRRTVTDVDYPDPLTLTSWRAYVSRVVSALALARP